MVDLYLKIVAIALLFSLFCFIIYLFFTDCIVEISIIEDFKQLKEKRRLEKLKNDVEKAFDYKLVKSNKKR